MSWATYDISDVGCIHSQMLRGVADFVPFLQFPCTGFFFTLFCLPYYH